MFGDEPAPRPTMTTFIVEDDAEVANLVKSALELAPCFEFKIMLLRKLSDVERVLRNCTNKPGVIILDLTLPNGASPLEVAQRIHNLAPDTPVVILTGLDNRQLAIELIEAGLAEDYLVKAKVPVAEIVERIRNAIARTIGRRNAKKLVETLDQMGQVLERSEGDPYCPPYPESVVVSTDETIKIDKDKR